MTTHEPRFETQEGPTLHLIVEEERIAHTLELAKKHVSHAQLDAREDIECRVEDAVRGAYRSGLTDGFQQGCIAEANARQDANVYCPAHAKVMVPRLRSALSELHALVRGECPSLLNEDSGGHGELDIEIEELLSRLDPNTFQSNPADKQMEPRGEHHVDLPEL